LPSEKKGWLLMRLEVFLASWDPSAGRCRQHAVLARLNKKTRREFLHDGTF
jgi:hypothetical protein